MLSSKFIWGVYVPSGIMILGIILDHSIPQFNLWKLLANIGKGIYHFKIPDFILAILIIAIILSLILINKKFQGLSPKKFKEMKAEKVKKLEPNIEIIFILDVLANQSDRTLEQRYLWDKYLLKFKEKKQSDFQIILNELENHYLIEETECGELGEICWFITTIGLTYLKKK